MGSGLGISRIHGGDPATPSVNAGINSDDFPTDWGTFQEVSELILSLPPGCVAATFDISTAYRITPVHPSQQHMFCVSWQDKVHVDFAVAFGCASSAGVFGSVADMLVAIYKVHGFGPIKKWVDDFFAVRLPGHSWTEEDFIELTGRLGRYIGFDWGLDGKTVAFPTDKFEATLSLLAGWLVPRARFCAADAARLHGKLVHAASIFPLIRPFLPSAARFANSFRVPRAHRYPPSALLSDLRWVLDILPALPRTVSLAEREPYDMGWWGDASTSFGIGVVVGGYWAVWQWADGVKVGPHQSLDIGWAEAVAVELGLLVAIESGLIHSLPSHARRLRVRSDNEDPPPLCVMPAQAVRLVWNTKSQSVVQEQLGSIAPLPSPLRPPCRAEERLILWKGVTVPPPSTIQHPAIEHLRHIGALESLRDARAYGSGLRKFHLFCDIFSIAEADRLPASFEVLNSFALWALADPQPGDIALATAPAFEPVGRDAVRKYLSAIRAWHLAQGWPAPLSADQLSSIDFHLRGLERHVGARRVPPRPPVTIHMLAALRAGLDLNNPFDACVWAAAACAFWGLMRFGEITVRSRAAFDGSKHIKRADAMTALDVNGKLYARLDLPAAKTARQGEIQSVYLVVQGPTVCPIAALRNLTAVVPAGPADPLFSWRDRNGAVRPLVRDAALQRINSIFRSDGWGTAFGHSFRIGGAAFFLAQGADPEIVRLQGRWRSMAYQVYIRAFEQVASHHLADLSASHGY
ncbi:hypothetical protein EVJ58_g4674 [Rhodofomes roseus]|uniref:Tyr recombinase domain-containing protein n=1 Tax=Rhodofomes roseus TaxID=34475 RepID=A0A4Y9YHV1_9APHY|nr:hypothetical protein EVJ58_g4674 [Rhodofomes roseus]